jgi:hypothetical protein
LRELGIKAALELPLYKSWPWPENALNLDTEKSSSRRATSARFFFELVQWGDFKEKAMQFWNEKVKFDVKTQQWWHDQIQDEKKFFSCYWEKMHWSNGA